MTTTITGEYEVIGEATQVLPPYAIAPPTLRRAVGELVEPADRIHTIGIVDGPGGEGGATALPPYAPTLAERWFHRGQHRRPSRLGRAWSWLVTR